MGFTIMPPLSSVHLQTSTIERAERKKDNMEEKEVEKWASCCGKEGPNTHPQMKGKIGHPWV